jgi:hypothetical protein
MWAHGHHDCLRLGLRDGRVPIAPTPCLIPSRNLITSRAKRPAERVEPRSVTIQAISAPGSFDPDGTKDAAGSSLDDRIASGEFTEGSTKAKFLKPFREFLETSGVPYGEYC